jgi:hypothetical protein
MEFKGFNCSEDGCLGHVSTKDSERTALLQAGCRSSTLAFACDTCGRLHFGPEQGVTDRSKPPQKAYLKEGKVVKI